MARIAVARIMTARTVVARIMVARTVVARIVVARIIVARTVLARIMIARIAVRSAVGLSGSVSIGSSDTQWGSLVLGPFLGSYISDPFGPIFRPEP
jgi:hypothetical protein